LYDQFAVAREPRQILLGDEAGERRRLGQAELIARGYLTQAPEQQSDAQAERRRDLLGVDLLDGDFISLV